MPDLPTADPPADLRDRLFAGLGARTVTAGVVVDDPGVVVETAAAAAVASSLGLTVTYAAAGGTDVVPGDTILTVVGAPPQVARCEDRLLGIMAKPSGIATAARRFARRAGPGLRVVAGAWKKVPPGQKDVTRAAVAAGGADIRICPPPFAYLDKNYVTMLGGVGPSLAAATAALPGHHLVVQLGRPRRLRADAVDAVDAGADIVFVDTGRPSDAAEVDARLRALGLRDRVELAFGGGVRLDDLDALGRLGIDTVDVGRAIVDAPLLDMHLTIVEVMP